MKEYKISKEQLQKYFDMGMSSRSIEKITGINHDMISWYAKKYGITNRFSKVQYQEDFFDKIDTKEKAYTLGFLIADCTMTKDNKMCCSLGMGDKEVLYKFSQWFGARVVERDTYKPESRTFPNATIKVGNNKIINSLHMLFGGRLKEERRFPIIKKELEPFMLQGFFDADGCITWGYRKDRNRLWQKVSFTSQYKLLIGAQNILSKYDISTRIYPKKDESCYVLEVCSPDKVLKTLNVLYSNHNFVVLQRKYNKSEALRRELGENGEGANSNNPVPSLQSRKV